MTVLAESLILPRETDVSTQMTQRMALNIIPLASAAIDTGTESRTAIAMAQEGGLGFIHRNMSVAARLRKSRR